MRVLIIDDQDGKAFRDALVQWGVLDLESDQVEVVTNLASVHDILNVQKELPEVIVLDGYFPDSEGEMPQFNASSVMQLLARQDTDHKPKVILVSGHPDVHEHWDDIVRWLDSKQLMDVLPKTDVSELTLLLLAKRIEMLHQLLTFDLSPRRLQVLRLVAIGCTNKKIAKQLGIEENTVRSHLRDIFDQLGVSNRTAAAAKAKDFDLTPDDELD